MDDMVILIAIVALLTIMVVLSALLKAQDAEVATKFEKQWQAEKDRKDIEHSNKLKEFLDERR